MKVFFSMSFRGDLVIGRHIYELIKKLGHTPTSTVFETDVPKEFYRWSSEQRRNHYKLMDQCIHEADLVVLEGSLHSSTIGKWLQDCIDQKRLLLILVKDREELAFLDSIDESEGQLLISEYTQDDLEAQLKEGIEYLRNKDTKRFTMLMPAEITRFLDEKSKKNSISRSEYIRALIMREMRHKV